MKKKKQKDMLSLILGSLIVLVSIILFVKILIPMVMGILFMFISLVKMYSLLSFEFKFLGGCFFLVVFWYIFSSLCLVSYQIFKFGISLISNERSR